MPPSRFSPSSTYQPLDVNLSGVPSWVFDRPSINLDDAMKQQAAQLALDLSNQSNQIAVKKQQRALNEDEALTNALVTKYADPNARINFNPADAASTMLEEALKVGDIDTAIKVAKIRDDYRSNNDPLSDSLRQIYNQDLNVNLPTEIKTKDAQKLVDDILSARRYSAYAQSVTDSQNRYEDRKSALLPEGYEGNPTPDNAKKFTTVLIGTQRVNRILDELEKSVARTGADQVTGQDFVLQRQLVGDLALELKSPAFGNLGAALSPSEYELLLTQLPRLVASPETSFGRVAVESGLGRDPLDAIRAIRNKVQRNLEIEGGARNIRKKAPSMETGTSQIDSLINSFSTPGGGGGEIEQQIQQQLPSGSRIRSIKKIK